jgi:adenosine deaminase
MSGDLERLARTLPKVVLHDHLDGSLRPATLLELLRARGLRPPADDEASLVAWFDARAHAGSLVEYLRGFALTVEAMASPRALERVAFEAAEDAHLDGAVLGEFRIAPLLFESHGVAPEAAVEAMLEGLQRSPMPAGLILCTMRQEPAEVADRVARLAVRYRAFGVVGFDLAGPERGHPPSDHVSALRIAGDGGVALTIHAGEADEGRRVLEAARLGARRIGHGVHFVELLGSSEGNDARQELGERGVHFEVCPTSNVHTGAARSVATHPITPLWRAGISLSFQTDNRLMSQITHSGEALALLRETSLGIADLLRMQLEAAAHAFLPESARRAAAEALHAWAARAGLAGGLKGGQPPQAPWSP